VIRLFSVVTYPTTGYDLSWSDLMVCQAKLQLFRYTAVGGSDAAAALVEMAENYIADLVKEATKLAMHAGRKTIKE